MDLYLAADGDGGDRRYPVVAAARGFAGLVELRRPGRFLARFRDLWRRTESIPGAARLVGVWLPRGARLCGLAAAVGPKTVGTGGIYSSSLYCRPCAPRQ